jgi:endonuclease YncB( thermonuclease family)
MRTRSIVRLPIARPLSRACAGAVALLGTAVPSFACQGGAVQAEAQPAAADRGSWADVWCDLEKVIDADTVHVRLEGQTAKLRLMCVDAEEKISGNPNFDPGKPQTVFGEESAQWAQAFFAALDPDGEAGPQRARVGLKFPGGRRELDAYGRLLCHLITPDGRDFNLLLVEQGRSPYFNKYGNSELCHEQFVQAQARAREQRLGIWHPDTNRPRTPGAPSARREYAELLSWWNARAQAVDEFRRRAREAPERFVAADDGGGLERACERGAEVEVFALLEKAFEEADGSQSLLLRGGDKRRALRLRVSAEHRGELARLDLEHWGEDGRQNYFYARGKLARGPRGFELWLQEPGQVRLAEPAFGPDGGAGAAAGAEK